MKRSKWPQVLLILAAAVVVLLIVAASWWRTVNTVPTVPMPVVKMPKPNAHDYFASAGKMLKDKKAIMECFEPRSPATLAQQEALVDENRLALAKLREGFPYDYLFPLRYGLNANFSEYSQFRGLAWLLALEGRVKTEHGDWGGAMESCQDAMLLGANVSHDNGNVIGRLAGYACQSIGRSRIGPTVGHLNLDQTRKAISRMNEIERRTITLKESLEAEKQVQLLVVQDMVTGRYKDPSLPDWSKMPKFVKRRAIVGCADFYDKLINAVQQPYASKPEIPEFKKSANPMYLASDIVLTIMLPFGDTTYFLYTRNLAWNRMPTVTLALHGYKLDHEAYPAKLEDLCPNYLKKLPDDPFALKGTFRYRLAGDKCVLWSLGPDGKDDGGKPITDLSKTDPRERYYVDKNSMGDIVAGVNK